MQSIMNVLSKALPVFVVLALGVLVRKKKMISRAGISDMKSFVVNITLPFVMFSAFAKAEYTINAIITPLVIFASCVIMLLLGHVGCRVLKTGGKLSPYLATGFEAGMLGYALFALLFPDEKTAAFALIDLGQVLFVFTVYKALLAGRGNLKSVVMEAVKAPTVWGIALGLIFGATGLFEKLTPSGVSGVLDSIASFIAAPTSAVILLTIGYDLAPGEINWKKTGKLALVRIAVSFVVLGAVILIDRFVLGSMMHLGALVLMFTLPPPYVLPVFADVETERADISSALSALTLVSIVLFMLLTVIFR
ncbi:MAG: hypothetical protein IJC48_05905 [Clostridia bacterium]|nr:hypothetical protein [Clostridia bacterium]MBQ4157030.1 hypothetical protein [Clostridia bacterium]